MIRVVPAGDLGLDVLLGGGFRLVTRLPNKASATVLVCGGAGSGKTLVGIHGALELARALDGDVAVGCVEILPSEYVAQLRSARPDIDESRVAVLPDTLATSTSPRVFCGLLTELDPETPDLVASLEALARDVNAAGGKPVVIVVDSLIEGYGIGVSTPRASADAVMKFAAQGGYALVLCEETQGAQVSPWVFAADTVVELGVEARERGRWIEVRKHRFGASVSGRHELELAGRTHPEVFPEPHAWVAGDVGAVLSKHGWAYKKHAAIPALVWDSELVPTPVPGEPPLEGAFTVVASPLGSVARSLAYALRPAGEASGFDLVVELDPLVTHEAALFDGSSQKNTEVCHLPTVHGAARALRTLVERFARSMSRAGPTMRRVIVGDLDLVLAVPNALAWVEAVRVFASLVIGTGCGVPVIAYVSEATGTPERASSILATYADLQIVADHATQAFTVERWRRKSRLLQWPRDVTGARLALDDLPRPAGRRTAR